ncbi:pectinesterase family protein [Rufibacter tibetensis]|uniref:Uncharacterized protein n=1 Tax=Rufibacter tibetensis TaxID=512763 RepID=A0A0P0C5C1_9BACT|nr:pectinesterase family protein [Rufibacter tibetensis]ALI98451.1 hypothetical protein DC20_04975 [Rufibacter tibetensis]
MVSIQLSKQLKLLLLLCMAIAFTTQAQQLAFPGAEGFGRFTTGGRGGAVYAVTNLNDSGAGSLREAVSKSGARTIVFRVSGTISLQSNLNITNGNITIAGQTAPGDGITIKNFPVNVNSDNVIIRYLRFRMGDEALQEADALGGRFRKGIIVDHCSMSWSTDECVSFYGNENFTLQWSIISESLRNSVHVKEAHGYGGIWGGKNASFHHNLLANHDSRNPRLGEEAGKAYALTDLVDLRNNVLYNWGNNSAYGGEAMNVNMVNNYYKPGPATVSSKRERILSIDKNNTEGTEVYNIWGKFYINGNFVEGSARATSDNWTYGVFNQFHGSYGTVSEADKAAMKLSEPHPIGGNVVTHAATEAYELVLQQAGASLKRDAVDVRIIEHVKNGTYTAPGSKGSTNGIIDSQADVGGWPALESTLAPQDTDNDGMPDAWEQQNGLNPNLASDGNAYGSNGYTNLENYLNSLSTLSSSKDPAILASGSFSTFNQAIGSPSAAQTLLVSGSNLTGNISIAAPANYQLSVDGTNWLNSITLTANAGTVSSTSIKVRLNAQATGTYSGTLVLSGGGAESVSFSLNGTTSMPEPEPESQFLGAFPDVDGGFENQTVGSSSTVSSHTSTTKWEASSSIQILNTNARTGSKVLHWNGASASVKYLLAPVLIAPTLQAGTKYVVQFWYKKPASSGAGSLFLSGYNSITGGMSGGTGTTTAERDETSHSTALSEWKLFQGVMTTQSGVTVTNTYPGIKVENPQSPYFDIDDYVIYQGSTFDMTAPDVATSPASKGAANSIAISWQAPASGVDGGGYLVVRSASATAPVPNANGVYVTGNTMGANSSVVFTGKNTQFSDNGSIAALASGTTYYYHIFTVDKAFNYSPAATISGAVQAHQTPVVSLAGTLGSFTQEVGKPSAAKTFTVKGTDLGASVEITAPAGFEISADETTWQTSLSLAPANNSLDATRFVRLNAPVAGSYSGNLLASSTGAANATLAIDGTTTAAAIVYTPANADAVVALDGTGNFTSIQAAINAAPTGRTTPYVIYIKNGKYVEKVNIPSNKPFLQFIGESAANTIISWDSYAGKVENGVTLGTNTSATLTVNANDFFMMSITVENASGYVGDGPQALALYVVGDRNAFKGCRFISGQDTVWHNGDGKRQYFKDCYIDGNTDFVFGSSIAVFDNCIIYGRDRIDGNSGGYVTAANTPAGQPYGEVFRDCRIPNNRGVTNYSLGRPWQNDLGKESKTVFLNTVMGTSVIPAGWSVWNATTNTSLITYAEYKSKKYNGELVDVSQRVSWSKQLTDAQAALYYDNTNLFGAWNPNAAFPALNNMVPAELAVANFRAQRGASSTTLSWNLSWPMSDVLYEVFRSTDNVNFTKVSTVKGSTDEVVAFSVTDGVPVKGTVYYYYVKASKAGLTAHQSYIAIVDPSIPIDGEFRSAGSGFWTNATTGNGANASSIWEKYSASTKTWVLQAKGVQPNSVNVTIREGHSVIVDGLKNANNLTIESGAVLKGNGGYNTTPNAQTLRIGAGSAASVLLQNDGVFGGNSNPDDLIIMEFNPACASVLWTGSGTSRITRLRPVPGNTNPLQVTFDQDVDLSFNNAAFTAYYNHVSNTTNENVTFTINKGKTVRLVHPSGSFSPTGTSTANPGGNYTYNIDGTLDLSATTTNSNLVPLSTNASSLISLNIGSSGTLKLGTGFNTVNSAPSSTSNGRVVMTVADGGTIDATKTTNLRLGTNYFIMSENAVLKRAVGATAVTFPIGTATNSYNPVTLTNTGTFDNFAITVKNTFDNPVTEPGKVVNKQWSIKEDVEGGSMLAAQFGWNAADQASAFDPAQQLYVMKYADGDWETTAATLTGSGTTASPYVATATGFTNLSFFGVTTFTKAIPTLKMEDGTFTYNGQPYSATAYAYGVNGSEDRLQPEVTLVYKDAAGTTLAGLPVEAGVYTVEAAFAGNKYYTAASKTAILTINPAAITVKADPLTKQWSDPDPVLSFVVEGTLIGTDTFTGSLERLAGEELGTYTVNQGTLALSSNYVLTFVPNILTITQEDALITFTGSQFVNTSCATCSGATVTLSATIQDISATGDAAGDVHPGDISKAKVRFVNRETNTAISDWLSVVLVNNADKLTGTAVYNWATTTGASDAADYTIGIEVDNGPYFRNSAADNVTVLVAKPLNDFVVGAGAISTSNSKGQYAADAGAKIHFAANVKYNKSGKNLQGRVNVIFSRTEADGIAHVYQLKGNVMNSLSTNTADQMNKLAVFTGKAAMVDITNPLNPLSVAGNLTLQVEMTDKGVTGANDAISFTVWTNEGGLLLSSKWTGTSSAKTNLSGGNISITGGSVTSGNVTSTQVSTMGIETGKPQVRVYPIPSNSYFTLVLEGTEGETAEVMVRDLTNRKVEQFKSEVDKSVQFGDKLAAGTYLVEIWQGGKRTTIKVVKQ